MHYQLLRQISDFTTVLHLFQASSSSAQPLFSSRFSVRISEIFVLFARE